MWDCFIVDLQVSGVGFCEKALKGLSQNDVNILKNNIKYVPKIVKNLLKSSRKRRQIDEQASF